jgi:hypothetical protein
VVLICSLEVDDYCRFDFIAVYDGSSTNSDLIGQVCGRVTPTFNSSSDSLTVVLSTDYANSYRGFSASYTSIYTEYVNTSKSHFMILAYFELCEHCIHRNCSLILSMSVVIPVCNIVTYTWEHSHNQGLRISSVHCLIEEEINGLLN